MATTAVSKHLPSISPFFSISLPIPGKAKSKNLTISQDVRGPMLLQHSLNFSIVFADQKCLSSLRKEANIALCSTYSPRMKAEKGYAINS